MVLDVRRAWGQIKIAFLEWKIYFIRYWKGALSNDVIGGFMGGLAAYLMGKFIGTVMYAGMEIPYATFYVVGWSIAYLYNAILRTFTMGSKNAKIIMVFSEHPLLVPFARTLAMIPATTVRLLSWALPICIAENIPITTPIIAYILGSLAILPALGAVGVLFTAMSFYIRGRDFWRISGTIYSAIRLLMPASFAVSAFGAAEGIALLVPTVAAVEGVRMIIFGLPQGIGLVAYGFLSGLAALILSYPVLKKTMDTARRKGWIMLE